VDDVVTARMSASGAEWRAALRPTLRNKSARVALYA
jgi:hypothetical protein